MTAASSPPPSSLVAVITGGGTGFGREIALALDGEFGRGRGRSTPSSADGSTTASSHKLTLILVGRRATPLERVRAELSGSEGGQELATSTTECHAVTGSVASLETWRTVAALVREKCDSQLHFLANNAALPDPGAPWDEMDDPQSQIVDFNAVNISSVELAYHYLVPFLVEGAATRNSRPSVVLNVSSCASVNPRAFAHQLPTYTPSKCAVDAITRCSYGLYKDRKVMSFAINPVAYDTPILELACENLGLDSPDRLAERYNPFPVVGNPSHVGRLAVALLLQKDDQSSSGLEAGCSYNLLPLTRELSSTDIAPSSSAAVKSPQSLVCSIDYANAHVHSVDPLAQLRGWSTISKAWDQTGRPFSESHLERIRAALRARIENEEKKAAVTS